MKLYNFSLAPNGLRVLAFLKEKKIKLDTHEVNVRDGEQFKEPFKSMNSFNCIPFLELDDGTIITEINLDYYNYKLLFVRGNNSPELLEQIIKDIGISFPNLIQNLEELEFIEKRRWNIKLKNKILINLPDENIQHSLKNLNQLFDEQEVMQSNIIEID